MIELLDQADKWLFLFLNGLHHPFLDPVMIFFSKRFGWIPFYALLLAGLIRYKRWETLQILLFTVLLIALTDQLSVWIKFQVARPRPCHNPVIQSLIHLPGGSCGGQFGFVSSHAANTFGLAYWIIKQFRPHIRQIGIIMFVWAGLVSYSRIYLGVHYPGDIIAGALTGLASGWLVWRIYASLPCRQMPDRC
ncbi:MAG TPA: phosphatase PAP2 family protein [Bacteroidales bacterium]|nr:phosphatase PAP2 family protein [Bacteroidales bacterium]